MSDLTGKRFRHIKRGTEYEVIGVGKMQSGGWLDYYDGPVDMREVVTYRSLSDGSLWTRPREEFEDGRFVHIATPDGVGLTHWSAVKEQVADRRALTIDADPLAVKPDPMGNFYLSDLEAGISEIDAALAAEKARVDEEGQRLLKAYEELADAEDRADTAEARCDTLAGALRTTKEACEIIAGKRQCLDNLMGNRDVAEAALVAIDAALATIPAKPSTITFDADKVWDKGDRFDGPDPVALAPIPAKPETKS